MAAVEKSEFGQWLICPELYTNRIKANMK